MRLREIKPNVVKPKTPQQQRLDNLQLQKDNMTKQLKAERDRQKIAKAQQVIINTKNNQSTL